MRVLRVGVCGTDLHAYRGDQPFMRYPVVPGHELAVEVVALGPHSVAPAVRVGDRCAVIPYLADGTCSACRRGLPNCCEALAVLGVHVDGGLRETMVVPSSSLLPANDVEDDVLAVVEMLAVGAHAVRRAGIGPDDDVLVVGAGPIGLSVLAFARLRARRAAIAETGAARQAFARGLDLAPVLASGGPGALAAALRETFGGDMPTVVLDATGSARAMEASLALAARGGRIVFVGHTKARLAFDNPVLHGHELAILASRNAVRKDFEDVLGAVRAGDLDPRPWITHRVGPEELVRELPGWAAGTEDVVKAIAVMA